MNNDKKEIGRRIRQVRKKLRLNQSEFGQRLGVATSSVSAYESGETSPSFDTILKIAAMGNISVDALLSGAPSENFTFLNNVVVSVEKVRQPFIRPGNTRPKIVQAYHGRKFLTPEEERLLSTFRQLDGQRRKRMLEDADDMLLAMEKRQEKKDEKHA